MNTRTAACCGLLLACLAGACSDDQATTPSSTDPLTATNLFTGALDVGGSSFYSFTVSQAGTVNVTLASVTASTGVPVATSPLGLGVGIPAGTDCSVNTEVDASVALSAQLSNSMSPGIYCVRIYDLGNLGGAVNFAVRIVHP